MPFELSEFLAQTMNMVPEADTELGAIVRNQIIKQALSAYSQDKPDTVSTDVTGDGGNYYALLTSLTSYDDGFSRIVSIDYPAAAIASDEAPTYLEENDWNEDTYAGGVRYLYLPNHAPAASETFRVTYSALYAWSAGTTTTNVNQTAHGFDVNDFVYQNAAGTWVSAGTGSTANLLATHQVTTDTDADNFVATILAITIPGSDFFAVCNKAACLICQAIAERFARTSDSAITADAVNHTTRSQLFADRAKEFCRLYNQHLGIKMDKDGNRMNEPLAQFVDLDTQPLWPKGRRYLFHSQETR